MAQAKDPFSTLRRQDRDSPANPFDSLESHERDATEQKIRDMFKEYASSGIRASMGRQYGLPMLLPDWKRTLHAAITMLPAFQRLVIDEFLTPNVYDFNKLKIDRNWLIGLYLRGFYDIYNSFDEGYEDVLQDLIVNAVRDAKATLESLLSNQVAHEIDVVHLASEAGSTPQGMKRPERIIVALFALVRQEKQLNNLRAVLYDELQGLKNMSLPIDEAEDLMQLYQGTSKGGFMGKMTLIDEFGRHAMDRLYQAGSLAPEEIRMNLNLQNIGQRQLAAQMEVDVVEEDSDDEIGAAVGEWDNLQHLHESPQASASGTYLEPTAAEEIVKIEAAKFWAVNPDVTVSFYPFWTAPSTGGVLSASPKENLQYDEEIPSDETSSSSVSKIVRRSSSFVAGRELSQREADEINTSLNSPEKVLSASIEYVKNVQYNMIIPSGYIESLRLFSGITQRSVTADLAKPDYRGFALFGQFLMIDNWWHVRCFIKAIEMQLGFTSRPNDASKAEMELMMLFAAIHRGAVDPLPWILVVDAVLRNFWRNLNKDGAPTIMVTKLYNELQLFANGTALSAMTGKCQLSSRNDQKEWYKMLWAYNPKCALPDCLRLLPKPEKMSDFRIRGIFSVGTRDARVGKRGVRRFVSDNRDFAYPCLYDILHLYTPIPQMVVVIFWYSHLYHSVTCKAQRGKDSINAL